MPKAKVIGNVTHDSWTPKDSNESVKITRFRARLEGIDQEVNAAIFRTHRDLKPEDIVEYESHRESKEMDGMRNFSLKIGGAGRSGGYGGGGGARSPRLEVDHETYIKIQEREWIVQADAVWSWMITGPCGEAIMAGEVSKEALFNAWSSITASKTSGAMIARNLAIKPTEKADDQPK